MHLRYYGEYRGRWSNCLVQKCIHFRTENQGLKPKFNQNNIKLYNVIFNSYVLHCVKIWEIEMVYDSYSVFFSFNFMLTKRANARLVGVFPRAHSLPVWKIIHMIL